MINYKMTIQYDGSRYNGFQRQGNTKNTIQEKIEDIFTKYIGENIEIFSSGRTDAGVNALGQVINFHCEKFFDNDKMVLDLNSLLPTDIRILDSNVADGRFHARLNAKGKHYSYRIDNGDVLDVFARKYTTRIDEKLDVDKMNLAAKNLIGEHDFISFSTVKKAKKSTVRNISDIKICEDNGKITIEVFGNGFLYNMVRIIAGTLIEVGLGKMSADSMQEIIDKKDRKAAGFIAPANGLFLVEVFY